MIWLELFLAFFEIGAMSFGGGYGMISLLSEKAAAHGWLSETEFMNLVAVSEATPGPIAINMATFIGSSQAGLTGALAATLGAVTPSFILILIIAALIKNFLEYAGVRAFLGGVRPCVIGLILGTAVTMFSSTLLGIQDAQSTVTVDLPGIFLFLLLFVISAVWKKFRKEAPSPILMLLFAGILGICIGPFLSV